LPALIIWQRSLNQELAEYFLETCIFAAESGCLFVVNLSTISGYRDIVLTPIDVFQLAKILFQPAIGRWVACFAPGQSHIFSACSHLGEK
jgi:hypothetical protein